MFKQESLKSLKARPRRTDEGTGNNLFILRFYKDRTASKTRSKTVHA
jgi:hypothetical protein